MALLDADASSFLLLSSPGLKAVFFGQTGNVLILSLSSALRLLLDCSSCALVLWPSSSPLPSTQLQAHRLHKSCPWPPDTLALPMAALKKNPFKNPRPVKQVLPCSFTFAHLVEAHALTLARTGKLSSVDFVVCPFADGVCIHLTA